MLQSRNPLGMALQSSLMPGEHDWQRPQGGMFPQQQPFPSAPPQDGPVPMAPRSKGQMIAGILSDGVKGFLGQQGTFGATLMAEKQRQQQMQQEEAQWTRRRDADRQDKQWEWQNKPAEIPSIIRETQAWQMMAPEQQAAYQAMQDARSGPVTTTLPNGQLYVGPKSGLAAAMGGQGNAPPPKPVGKLTPISGGPTQPASGTFRP